MSDPHREDLDQALRARWPALLRWRRTLLVNALACGRAVALAIPEGSEDGHRGVVIVGDDACHTPVPPPEGVGILTGARVLQEIAVFRRRFGGGSTNNRRSTR